MKQPRRRGDVSPLEIEAWLSPVSDHFPTPRGIHHLSAAALPPSPSSMSGDGSSTTTNSTNMWNRGSFATDNTEFEDLYGVSEEEGDDDDDNRAVSRQFQQSSVERTFHARTVFQPISKKSIRLIIPASARNHPKEPWSPVDEFKKIITPVPITSCAQLSMSPAQRDFMGKQQAVDVPTVSAPPSLDGSLSSEHLAVISAPATPVLEHDEDKTEENWAGVHLQPDALAILQALSSGEENEDESLPRVIHVSMTASQPTVEIRQQPLRLTSAACPAVQAQIYGSSPTRQSFADLARLDIPSPGDFFSGLSPRTRNAWHPRTQSPPADLPPPPTSTTAEQFYRCPWNNQTPVPPVPECPSSAAESVHRTVCPSSDPVEQVIDVRDDDGDDFTDDLPTARPAIQHKDSNELGDTTKAPAPPEADEAPAEIIVDYDAGYARKQQREALDNLGRTELWLLAQRAYLKGVDGQEDNAPLQTMEESSGGEDEVVELELEAEAVVPQSEAEKKVVRGSNTTLTTSLPKQLPPKPSRQQSAYYRSFQDYITRAQLGDVFVQQLPRFEALQAQRTALREAHRNQLLGKYQLSVAARSAKKRLSANVARGDLVLVDDPARLRKEQEIEAMNQMAIPAWRVAALKFLNGGRLISAPVTKRLMRPCRLVPDRNGASRDEARILDLGGQSTGDWAWHVALQYPSTKIYTVTTEAIHRLSNSNIRGPPNHSQIAVRRLTRLPFADDQFDLISARELHGILKFIGESGEDEWESCLSECMRVLKPGGYLEFSIMDSGIINAGPLGLAKSVEFGFTLKTLGYDPNPSRLWLGRLARAGFEQVRRAWVCLPVGARRKIDVPPTPPMKDDVFTGNGTAWQMDTTPMGSSDSIANVCSIIGGWSWERWLLRCEMENVAGEMRLADTVTAGAAMREAGKCLEGVHAVMEEGRSRKAGFRLLNGYARKPRRESHVIHIALAKS